MSKPEHHLSRRDAERLLDDPASYDSALGSALSAARAPARSGELRGEDVAVAAFHRARLDPAPASSRRGGRAAARAVVATAAVVALTSGGFALASSGHLPLLPDRASDQATQSVTRTSPQAGTTDSTETTDPGRATGTTATTEAGEAEATESTTGSATPTPNLAGLCKAFQAADRSDRGAALESAAFAALVEAAGGADRVATHCVDLVGEPRQTGKPTTRPTPTGKPSPTKPRPTKPSPAKPSPAKPAPTRPSPTGKPSAVPSPTAKPSPTGLPATLPTPSDKPTPSGRPSDAGGSGADSQTSGR